ncbi:UNVERIFIED_CONTAM: hypothetical protein NY603_37275, partial [Bacteroidetes bacterium 56_B9]
VLAPVCLSEKNINEKTQECVELFSSLSRRPSIPKELKEDEKIINFWDRVKKFQKEMIPYYESVLYFKEYRDSWIQEYFKTL